MYVWCSCVRVQAQPRHSAGRSQVLALPSSPLVCQAMWSVTLQAISCLNLLACCGGVRITDSWTHMGLGFQTQVLVLPLQPAYPSNHLFSCLELLHFPGFAPLAGWTFEARCHPCQHMRRVSLRIKPTQREAEPRTREEADLNASIKYFCPAAHKDSFVLGSLMYELINSPFYFSWFDLDFSCPAAVDILAGHINVFSYIPKHIRNQMPLVYPFSWEKDSRLRKVELYHLFNNIKRTRALSRWDLTISPYRDLHLTRLFLNSTYGLELLNSACEKSWKEMSVLETHSNDLFTRKHSPEEPTNNWPIDNFP